MFRITLTILIFLIGAPVVFTQQGPISGPVNARGRDRIEAEKRKARSRINQHTGVGRRSQFRTVRRTWRYGKSGRRAETVKLVEVDEALRKKHGRELLNKDYFFFRMVASRQCTAKKSSRKYRKCRVFNEEIEISGKNFSLLRDEYDSAEFTDFSISSKEVDGKRSESFKANNTKTAFYVKSLGQKSLDSIAYKGPLIQALKKYSLTKEDEVASNAFGRNSVTLAMPEGPLKIKNWAPIIVGDTYLIRIILPTNSFNPFDKPQRDHIYAIKVVERNKEGVFTMVARPIWTYEKTVLVPDENRITNLN